MAIAYAPSKPVPKWQREAHSLPGKLHDLVVIALFVFFGLGYALSHV